MRDDDEYDHGAAPRRWEEGYLLGRSHGQNTQNIWGIWDSRRSQAEITHLIAQIEHLHQRNAVLAAHVNDLNQRNAALHADVNQLRGATAELTAAIDEWKAIHDSMHKNYVALSREAEETKRAWAIMRVREILRGDESASAEPDQTTRLG